MSDVFLPEALFSTALHLHIIYGSSTSPQYYLYGVFGVSVVIMVTPPPPTQPTRDHPSPPTALLTDIRPRYKPRGIDAHKRRSSFHNRDSIAFCSQVLRASDGQPIRELRGATKGVTCLAVSDTWIAAACEDFATYIYQKVSFTETK